MVDPAAWLELDAPAPDLGAAPPLAECDVAAPGAIEPPVAAPGDDDEIGPPPPDTPFCVEVASLVLALPTLRWSAPVTIGRRAAEAIASWLSRVPQLVQSTAMQARTSRVGRRLSAGLRPCHCSIVPISLPPAGPITDGMCFSLERERHSRFDLATRKGAFAGRQQRQVETDSDRPNRSGAHRPVGTPKRTSECGVRRPCA